ncbi:Ribosome-associated factor Y [Neochlamydia sp. AcF95]|nr:Ribosome-associated factor Y [Neochlamydia sp. AcF95]
MALFSLPITRFFCIIGANRNLNFLSQIHKIEVSMSRKSKAAEFVDEEYSLTINGRNIQVTEAMEGYIKDKLSKIEKYDIPIIDIMITMDIQRFEHHVNLLVKLNHILIKSSAVTDDMYASIDKAVDKIQTQLKKYKQKIKDHHAKPLEMVDMAVNVLRPLKEVEAAEINEEIEAENASQRDKEYRPHHIVKQEKKPLKYLTLDEAIMKMELSGEVFLLFRNEVDRKLNVIYRREDGDYDLLMPEG